MILVDSDVLIAHLRGVAVASDLLVGARNDGPLAISAVSIVELIGGTRGPSSGAKYGACSPLFVWRRRPGWSRAAPGSRAMPRRAPFPPVDGFAVGGHLI